MRHGLLRLQARLFGAKVFKGQAHVRQVNRKRAQLLFDGLFLIHQGVFFALDLLQLCPGCQAACLGRSWGIAGRAQGLQKFLHH